MGDVEYCCALPLRPATSKVWSSTGNSCRDCCQHLFSTLQWPADGVVCFSLAGNSGFQQLTTLLQQVHDALHYGSLTPSVLATLNSGIDHAGKSSSMSFLNCIPCCNTLQHAGKPANHALCSDCARAAAVAPTCHAAGRVLHHVFREQSPATPPHARPGG